MRDAMARRCARCCRPLLPDDDERLQLEYFVDRVAGEPAALRLAKFEQLIAGQFGAGCEPLRRSLVAWVNGFCSSTCMEAAALARVVDGAAWWRR